MRKLIFLAVPLTLLALPDPDGNRRILRHDTILETPLATSRSHVFEDVHDLHYDLPSGKVFAFEVTLPPEDAGERPDSAFVPSATIEWKDRARRFETSWTLDDVVRQSEGHDRALSHALMRRNPRSGAFLKSLEVHLGDEKVGEVERLYVEARTARIAFVGVLLLDEDAQPVDVYSVPWSECRVDWIADGETESARPVLRVSRDPALAPDPDSGVLDDPLYRDRVYEAFGVSPPWWDRGQ